jgi:hypothetical protein
VKGFRNSTVKHHVPFTSTNSCFPNNIHFLLGSQLFQEAIRFLLPGSENGINYVLIPRYMGSIPMESKNSNSEEVGEDREVAMPGTSKARAVTPLTLPIMGIHWV